MPNIYPHLADGTDSPVSIYQSTAKSTTHPLGTRAYLGPRVFYWAKSSGAAISRSTLCRTPLGPTVFASCSVTPSAAAGATSLSAVLGASSIAANAFHRAVIIDGASSWGQERRIVSHASVSSTGTITVALDEPLETAVAAGDEVTFRYHELDNVVVTPGDAICKVAGAPQFDVPAGTTNAQYFWLQTWGPGMGQRDGSAASEGSLLTYATSTTADAGQLTIVQIASSTALPAQALRFPIAECIDPGDTSDLDAVFVNWRIQP